MLTVCVLAPLTIAALGAAPIHEDYAEAFEAAKSQSKMLLISIGSDLDLSTLDPERASQFVLCKLPADASTEVEGKSLRLLEHSSFSDLDNGPGIAVIDLKNEQHSGQVVSVLPNRHVSRYNVHAVMDLPPGTLSQRTLVWALRIHPMQPQSVWGTPAPELVSHAANHSRVQARSNNQHHNLPTGIASSEIVAESWPWNHNVVDAAIDIVDSWRQSPGHWGAASRRWSYFGYDMKHNGSKWYATGVFR